MNTQKYVDGLFSRYEETPALVDFKEELRSNLDDRIANLIKKGMKEQDAFEKASAELGDISALADEISLKKKKEVFSEMYMKTRSYMSTKRIALYVLCGTMLGFAVIVTLLTSYYTSGRAGVAGSMGSFLVFGGSAILGFIFLGLTQETAVHESMPCKRALWYVAVSGVFLFGVFTFAITYLYGRGISEAAATLIPFVLPSAALGAFLIMTEKDRRKPWVKEMVDEQIKQNMERFANPAQEERFGLISGAVWISAVALFIILTIQIGILYSWLAFVGALVVQMLVLASFSRDRK